MGCRSGHGKAALGDPCGIDSQANLYTRSFFSDFPEWQLQNETATLQKPEQQPNCSYLFVLMGKVARFFTKRFWLTVN
jgi:hypothetical protein